MSPRTMDMSKYRSKDKGWAKGQRPGLMRGPECSRASLKMKARPKDGSKDDGWV